MLLSHQIQIRVTGLYLNVLSLFLCARDCVNVCLHWSLVVLKWFFVVEKLSKFYVFNFLKSFSCVSRSPIPTAYEVWGKLMLSRAFVCRRGRGSLHGGGSTWRGICMQRDLHRGCNPPTKKRYGQPWWLVWYAAYWNASLLDSQSSSISN